MRHCSPSAISDPPALQPYLVPSALMPHGPTILLLAVLDMMQQTLYRAAAAQA